ncbi:MAG: AMP-binding protein [Bacteroidaceae bacterium]|nr:AMP-binding protein [Bacteroidaceae bacterium]
MNSIASFNRLIENTIVDHWDLDALTDYKGVTYQYKDVARKIEKLHILFEESGVDCGDKIAICGRNSTHWAVAFLATLTYGAIAVPILHEFTPEQVHSIVNHSEAKLLFVGDVVGPTLKAEEMPDVEGIINIQDFSIAVAREEKLTFAREHLNELFGKKYPKNFRREHVQYYIEQNPDELALINYTSGTTGFSKGVMIPYRALWSNMDFAEGVLSHVVKAGDHVVSILPMAHMYGMAFEFLYEFMAGCHIWYLSRVPSPAIIAQAFREVKPVVIIAVPLVIEKIIRKRVFPKLTPNIKVMMKLPIIGSKIKKKICDALYESFGGNLYEIIIGGAAFNYEIESFLREINFPVTVGYGATECAPIITYEDYKTARNGSCGRKVVHMDVKIDSPDPQNVAGEILARGYNVMLGYYKNDAATRDALDADGWYHTGDLGTMDADGFVYIRGRSKNMLLTPNGQNVYPEEIEDKLNSMPYVVESVMVQRNDKFVGLVYPDYAEAEKAGISKEEQLAEIMEQNRVEVNKIIASYAKLQSIELRDEEFEKTPKKSIKRFMYN